MGGVSFDLTGRFALISGGTRGIGRAIAEAFIEAGATVTVIGRDRDRTESAAQELSRPGRPAYAVAADLEADGAAEVAVSGALAAMGRIDILVNNAGVSQGGKPALDVDAALLDRVMSVNFRSPFLLCREAGRHMIERGQGGRIINITSIDGLRAYANGVVYSASKGALELLTKSLAVEWAPHGILVNSIAPGWIRTDMTQRVFGQPLEQQVLSHTPLARWGETADLAGMALFLASDAGAFTTGATMVIDGGYVQG